MSIIPHNAIPVYREGVQLDDSGKNVIVNSVGGALHDTKGVVVYGPYQFKYKAMAKSQKKTKKGDQEKLAMKEFITDPYWCVLLEGYELQIHFVEKELTFV